MSASTAGQIADALAHAQQAAATPSPPALNRLILELGTAQLLYMSTIADGLAAGLLALDRIEQLLARERSGS